MSEQSQGEKAVALAAEMLHVLAPLFTDRPGVIITEASVRMAAAVMVQMARPDALSISLREAARWLNALADRYEADGSDLTDVEVAGHG